MKLLFVILGFCTLSSCFIFRNKAFPPWNELSVPWRKFDKLPMNEQHAIKNGWTLSKDACKDSTFFKGKRYFLNGDISNMLLFDSYGHIAGMQLAVSNKVELFNKNQIGGPIYDDGTNYYLTAYFTEQNDICNGKQRNENVIGNKLLFLMNGDGKTMEIPLEEEQLKGTNWVKGKCFWTMGMHYWYNIRKDIDCNDLLPFFLLYNGNILNGFGFATQFDINTSKVEHPPKKKLWLFMDPATQPKCLESSKYLTTQHVYLQKRPYLNHC